MGARDSSSKRKSSKRKRDKISSKKKSKRKEPKKRHRVYDSVSSDTDDDALNSEHSTSSTSKNDRRKKINKNKKRRLDSPSSSYASYESMSSDSDSDNAYKSRKVRKSRVGLKDAKRSGRKRFKGPSGKKKRSDRDRAVKPLKRSSKKKPKKYSSSSSSSDSDSCSTCKSSSTSSTADGSRKRREVIHDKEIERPRARESHKVGKRRKLRTPSSSSCDMVSYDPSVDETVVPLNNSRRLRSVIVVVGQSYDDEGEKRQEMEMQKEEIVYDKNDYPSPKSVESDEGVENVACEEVPEQEKYRPDEVDQDKFEKEVAVSVSEGVDIDKFEKEIDVSVSERVNLEESLLRQKALENLRKFKGRLQTGPRIATVKMNNESDVGKPSTGTVDIAENKLIKQGSSDVRETDQIIGSSSKRDLFHMQEVEKHQDSEYGDKDPGTANEGDKCATSHDVSPIPASTAKPSSVGPNLEDHSTGRGKEAGDGSQFEQKMMSVMRGGEMVQVSYKVYIPKKAPALARRQLRR